MRRIAQSTRHRHSFLCTRPSAKDTLRPRARAWRARAWASGKVNVSLPSGYSEGRTIRPCPGDRFFICKNEEMVLLRSKTTESKEDEETHKVFPSLESIHQPRSISKRRPWLPFSGNPFEPTLCCALNNATVPIQTPHGNSFVPPPPSPRLNAFSSRGFFDLRPFFLFFSSSSEACGLLRSEGVLLPPRLLLVFLPRC